MTPFTTLTLSPARHDGTFASLLARLEPSSNRTLVS
jgi:hypothetical protein